MASAWDRAKDMAEKHANAGGIFIRLQNDGDKVVGVFVGEPHPREVHWTGEKYDECAGDGCTHCAAGLKAAFRVSMNFFVPAEGAMKVIEGGSGWFGTVLTVRDKYGLDKWSFEVKRVGKPKDPKTTYTILPEEKIDDALRARIAKAAPHDLARIGKGDAYEGEDDADATHAGDAPVPAATATHIHEQLKKLSRADVDVFLKTFRIARIRELRVRDAASAQAFLDARLAPPAESEGDDAFF